MRLLQVYHIFPASFGGVSTIVYQITKELCKRGHEVHVLTTNAYFMGEEDRKEEVKVHRFALISRTLSKYNLIVPEMKFLSWVKMIKKYDCIHIHGYRNLYNAIIHRYAIKYDVPYVLQAHGSLPRIMGKNKLKLIYDAFVGYKLLRDASKVIALNRVETEQYKSMGVPEDKIVIIPNGIDLSKYAKLPPKGVFKKKFNVPKDKKIILYLGRIHKIKGIDFLVMAYAYLVKKMNFKEAILVIVGPDDGYLNEVKALAYDLGVLRSTLFTGPLYGKNKLEAYIDSEVYVLPSRYETFPMTILEAYACSKPVIASNVGGLKDLVIDGETGLLFEIGIGDYIQLAEKLLYLLENPGEALRMGLKGKKLVKEKYSIKKVVDRLEHLYKQC